jgi:predicted ATPase
MNEVQTWLEGMGFGRYADAFEANEIEPAAALKDANQAVQDARAIGHAATLLYALIITSLTHIWSGTYAAANAQLDEAISLADEKSAAYWKACGMTWQGSLLAVTGEASSAVQIITGGLTAYRSTRATNFIPLYLSYLTTAYAELGQLDDAWRCIGEAMTAAETTSETWIEAEVHRTTGEITLMSPKPEAANAEAHFERALAIARGQQAKSWELRAAMSMARLWRDQGKRQQARDLLAPVYGWFTEGFDTPDLRQAMALLEDLTA